MPPLSLAVVQTLTTSVGRVAYKAFASTGTVAAWRQPAWLQEG